MNLSHYRGEAGEQAAAEYLLEHGFEIIARNWRTGHYELDIVARRFDTLHFVEVKCRHENSLTSPEQAITPDKMRSLMRAVTGYLALYQTDLEIQIDLIAVEMSETGVSEIRYIPDAIIPRW